MFNEFLPDDSNQALTEKELQDNRLTVVPASDIPASAQGNNRPGYPQPDPAQAQEEEARVRDAVKAARNALKKAARKASKPRKIYNYLGKPCALMDERLQKLKAFADREHDNPLAQYYADELRPLLEAKGLYLVNP